MNVLTHSHVAKQLGQHFSGPIIFYYVWWVLRQAEDMGLRRLYFLARDGYLLREIALRFCEVFDLKIDCRYLYVSRASLRMPTYCFIGEEAWELLTMGGYQVTLRSLLSRAELTSGQRLEVYRDCGEDVPDEDRLLSRQELARWGTLLKKSNVFHRLVNETSKAAYGAAVGYLRQEGLLDGGPVALVDSGWTGSMQRSLRQLLGSDGFSGHLIGFYFGMFAAPKASEDGTYLTWYFDHGSSPFVKIPFCNNLFECLLAAPHGMTAGYEFRDGRYVPVTLSAPQEVELAHTEEQISAVLEYVNRKLHEIDFDVFSETEARQETGRRIRRYMAHPRREEAAYYGEYRFCDDVTEVYMYSLADQSQIDALKGYLIPARVWRRLRGRSKAVPELFWPYGTMAFLPAWKRWWYRLNVYVWEWLRYVLR